MIDIISYKPKITTIQFNQYEIGVLRLDEIHPEISGNKWFKLNYNLQQARQEQKNTILTFGGAYSNHIAATAAACKLLHFKSIGIIRGEETSALNATLTLAKQDGMQLLFVNRNTYKQTKEPSFLQALQAQYPQAYIIPEGGDNNLGQKGCEEILCNETQSYTRIFCAYGTGTTFKGLANSLLPHQKLTAINVLKYEATTEALHASINNNYHFGGYAKHKPELLEFKIWFETTYNIPLDYVYTAKSFYAVFDLIKQQQISPKERILIIHCGGLQGNKGYEERYLIF